MNISKFVVGGKNISEKLSSKLFDAEKFTAYGYEVKIYRMKDSDLPSQVKITPADMYHPELTYLQGELIILFQGSYAVADIDKLKDCLEDVRKLNNELQKRQDKLPHS